MQTTQAGEKPLSGLRILVTDDAVDSQKLMQFLLRRGGAVVDLADDGVEALDRVAAQTYDLILMDLHMPRMDGQTAARALRAGGYAGAIMALTGADIPENRHLFDGFDAYETKPIDAHRFLQSVALMARAGAEPVAIQT